MINERTLVVFKPDIIQRQIVGEILTRFEKKGFKIVAMKMLTPSKELVGEHYTDDEKYLISLGEKVLGGAQERGDQLTETDPYKLGAQIRQWCVDYLTCGPVVAIVLQGAHIVDSVRRMIGKTNPLVADVGTIRADYTPDSMILANLQGRVVRTMVHASDSVENANREIPLWFTPDEISQYETAIEKILYDSGWTHN